MFANLVSTAEDSLRAAVGFQPNDTKPSDQFCGEQLDWPPSQVIFGGTTCNRNTYQADYSKDKLKALDNWVGTPQQLTL